MTEETLFAAALDKATPAERAVFLEEACAGDLALRRRVEALMASHEHSQFLRTPAVQQAAVHIAGAAPTQGEASAGEDTISLSFLSTSEKAGSLGRLGHYEIQEVIGKGGMGIVLRAFDEKLHRVVAIKVMAPALATSGAARRRFVREARAAAAIRNDHVIDIHAVEENSEPPYLVMEYIEGPSLQEWLDKTGPLDPKEILRIGMQTAAGMAAADTQGLIHRDVKPANILLENGVQRVKITDFGLARLVDDESLTQSGVLAGTPQYMSPEQARGDAVDHRTDLFSLGSVLYAMCTGRPPFRASGTMAVLRRVEEESPRPIRETNPETPEWLTAIVDKLLAKNPADRFQSAAELSELLSQYLAHLHQPTSIRQPPGPRRRRGRWLAAALLTLVAGLAWTEFSGFTRMMATLIGDLPPAGNGEPEASNKELAPREPRPKDNTVAALAPAVLEGHTAAVHALDFSPDGKTLATASADQSVRLWEADAWATKSILRPDPGLITGVAFSRDGMTLATTSNQRNLKLWDIATLQLKATASRGDAQTAVVFLPERKTLVTSGQDHLVTIWSWDRPKLESKDTLQLGSAVRCLGVAPGEKALAAGCWNGKLFVWDLATLKERSILAHANTVLAVAFSPDGKKVVTAGRDKLIKVWDIETLQDPVILRGHEESVYSLAFSQNGTLVSAGGHWNDVKKESTQPGEVKLWEVSARKELASLKLSVGCCVFCARFSPDGKTLATGHSDKLARIWDVKTILAQSNESEEKSAQDGPFMILAKVGPPTQKFATLAEAAAAARDGDNIEIRGNGPFVMDPVEVRDRVLCIRAAKGYRPVLKLSDKGVKDDRPILLSNAPLALEGLEFQRIGKGPASRALVHTAGVPLRVANCRFVVRLNNAVCIWASGALHCEVRNCEFLGATRCAVESGTTSAGVCRVDNCVITAEHGLNFHLSQKAQKNSLHLARTTLIGKGPLQVFLLGVPDAKLHHFRIETAHNVFDADKYIVIASPLGAMLKEKPGPPEETKKRLGALLGWLEQTNLYPAKTPWLGNSVPGKGVEILLPAERPEEWRQLFGAAGAGSLQGQALYAGGNVRAKLGAVPETLTPKDFALRPESPGYRAGPGGQDLGPDIDLVGPGAAYERWQTTTEYQQWLKDTWQVKREVAAEPKKSGAPIASPGSKDKKPARSVPSLVLKGHSSWVFTLAFSRDGEKLATGCNDQSLRLWNARTGMLERKIHADAGLIHSMAFSRDGRTLATTSNGETVKIWESSELGQVAVGAIGGRIGTALFSPDGQHLATGNGEGVVKIWSWDGTKLEEKHSLRASARVDGLSFSPKGTMLAAGCWDGKVFLWDMATLKQRTIVAHGQPIRAMAFSPEGKWLASASYDKLIKLWDVETLEDPIVLRGHKEKISSLDFSVAGNLVSAGGDWDGTQRSTQPGEVKFWDVSTRKELAGLELPIGCVFCARFSPDGKKLATAHHDATARVWDVAAILAEVHGATLPATTSGLAQDHGPAKK